jgi:serine/threonine protein kinase
VGIIAYQIAPHNLPFDSENLDSLKNLILNKGHEPLPETFSNELQSIVFGMLNKTPQFRPSADNLIAFIKDNFPILEQDSCSNERVSENSSQSSRSFRKNSRPSKESSPPNSNPPSQNSHSIQLEFFPISNIKQILDFPLSDLTTEDILDCFSKVSYGDFVQLIQLEMSSAWKDDVYNLFTHSNQNEIRNIKNRYYQISFQQNQIEPSGYSIQAGKALYSTIWKLEYSVD